MGRLARAVGLALLMGWAVAWAGNPAGRAAPTGVRLPEGYRVWTAVAPSLRTDKGHIRLMLANPVMAGAYRDGSLPFPPGSVIVKLVYRAERSPEWDGAVVPGEPVVIEVMEKDPDRFGATGGWGFGRFRPDGSPVEDPSVYETCFPCHRANVKDHDLVFTRWAP